MCEFQMPLCEHKQAHRKPSKPVVPSPATGPLTERVEVAVAQPNSLPSVCSRRPKPIEMPETRATAGRVSGRPALMRMKAKAAPRPHRRALLLRSGAGQLSVQCQG